MQISPHFYIQEFVSEHFYRLFRSKSLWFVDSRLITLAEHFRTHYNQPLTINNWNTGGGYKESGLRSFDSTTGAQYSQHKFGRAIDMKIANTQPEAVRNYIRENFKELNKLGLTTIEENTGSWVHIDIRYTGKSTLYEVPYK